MSSQGTSLSATRKSVASQGALSTRRPVVSLDQFRRIVSRLEAGERERSIAAAEELPEIVVCRIRQLSLDIKNRQMAAVGIAVGTMLDTVRSAQVDMLDTVRLLHKEIQEGVWEELNEGAA